MRNILQVISVLVCVCALHADIGEMPSEVIKDFPQSTGALFCLQENKDIELKKEILIFQGVEGGEQDIAALSHWNAYFEFGNNSAKDLTVNTGFPMELSTRFSYNDEGTLVWYGKKEWSDIVSRAGIIINGSTVADPLLSFLGHALEQSAKNPEQFSYKKKFSRGEFADSEFSWMINYEISVNGENLDVENVLVDCSVTKEDTDYLLHVTYVFTHKINFRKNSLTRAVCRVYQPAHEL